MDMKGDVLPNKSTKQRDNYKEFVAQLRFLITYTEYGHCIMEESFLKFAGEEHKTCKRPKMDVSTYDRLDGHRVPSMFFTLFSALCVFVWVSAEVSIGAHFSCRWLHNTDIFHSVNIKRQAHWLLLNSDATSLNDFRLLAELVGKVYISCV